jgi:hypothetical protein
MVGQLRDSHVRYSQMRTPLSATGMSALCDKPTFAQLFCVAGDQASEMAVHRLSSEVHHKAIVLSPTLLEIAFYFPSTLSIRLSGFE